MSTIATRPPRLAACPPRGPWTPDAALLDSFRPSGSASFAFFVPSLSRFRPCRLVVVSAGLARIVRLVRRLDAPSSFSSFVSVVVRAVRVFPQLPFSRLLFFSCQFFPLISVVFLFCYCYRVLFFWIWSLVAFPVWLATTGLLLPRSIALAFYFSFVPPSRRPFLVFPRLTLYRTFRSLAMGILNFGHVRP